MAPLRVQERKISPTRSAVARHPRVPLVAPALRLPRWVAAWLARRGAAAVRGTSARMALAIDLARENARHASGGPFGAVVFSRGSGRIVAVGVNRVAASGLSLAHAEMLALALAQRARGSFDLGSDHELVTSSEPCAMCFGAIPWSGVRRLVCGARAADAEAIGFEEGPKPRAWVAALERRGIAVVRDVRRREAIAVLRDYAASGAPIYNASRRRRDRRDTAVRGGLR